MKQLPSYDVGTSRLELAIFVVLGLIAVALIGAAALDSARFTNRKDNLFDQAVSNAVVVQIKQPDGPTNLTIAQPPTLGERTRLGGPIRPKS